MSINIILNLQAFAKTFETQSSSHDSIAFKKNAICKWFGHRLSGRTIQLLKSEIDDTYQLLIEGREGELFPYPTPPRCSFEIEEECIIDFMRRNNIEDTDEAKEKMYQAYKAYFISNLSVIKYMSNYDDDDIPKLLDVILMNSWTVSSIEGNVTLSLLQLKENKSLVWRITAGKVHMIVDGYCQTICRFPRVNETDLDDMNTPIRWPLMLDKINKDFLKAHRIVDFEADLNISCDLERIGYDDVNYLSILFTPTYHTENSKFDIKKKISEYEWAVTLISYHGAISCEDGAVLDMCPSIAAKINSIALKTIKHSAIIIEKLAKSEKDGVLEYTAEQIHITQWEEEGEVFKTEVARLEALFEANEGRKFLKEEMDKVKKELKKRAEIRYHPASLRSKEKGAIYFLKDCEKASDFYRNLNLEHSKTWIRTKEDIENMLADIDKDIKRQTISNPVVMFDSLLGKFAATPVKKIYAAYNRSTYKDYSQDFEQHNCTTWAIEKLVLAGINIDTGLVTKYFASLPSSYAHSEVTAAEDVGIVKGPRFLPSSKETFLRILRYKKEKAEDQLKDFFITRIHSFLDGGFNAPVYPFIYMTRPNFFIAQGEVSERNTLQFLLNFLREGDVAANQGLSNYSEIFRQSHNFLAENHPESLFKPQEIGITFNKIGFHKMIKPIGDRLVETGLLMKRFINEFRIRKSYLRIMESHMWDKKEDGRNFPKTYRKTVQEILSLCLTIELCETGLNFSKYSDKNEFIYC